MTKLNLILCLIALFGVGCAHNQSPLVEGGRLTKLNRQTRLKERKEEEARLQKLLRTEKVVRRQQLAKAWPLPKSLSDESLYTEVLKSYRLRDLSAIEYYSQQLVTRFPQSVFGDNALYLQGQLSLAMGVPSEALRVFEKILKEYPTSNKRASSLFGKGVAYRKLQLYKYAEPIFEEVKRTYPGSPEFYKVELEQKLLKLEKNS